MPFTLTDCLVSSEVVSRMMFSCADAVTESKATTNEQALVELFAKAATGQIQNYCDRLLLMGTYTEVWDGQGSDLILPKEFPIVSVASIKFASDGGFSGAIALQPQTYSVTEECISLRGGVLTPNGVGQLQVIYDAGYATIPMDLQLACVRQIQYMWGQTGKQGGAMTGLKEVSKMQERQVKDDTIASKGLIADVIGTLDNYRRMEAPSSVRFSRVT